MLFNIFPSTNICKIQLLLLKVQKKFNICFCPRKKSHFWNGYNQNREPWLLHPTNGQYKLTRFVQGNLILALLTQFPNENMRNGCCYSTLRRITYMSSLIPLKRDIVAGVTVLTLGSGGSSFLMQSPFNNAGLLSMMATFKCLVSGILAKKHRIRQ